MKHLMASIGIVGLLAACNGSDDSTTTEPSTAAQTAQAEAPAAASETAQAVRKTIEALRRGGGGADTAAQAVTPSPLTHDPGARLVVAGLDPDAGNPFSSLTAAQKSAFDAGLEDFKEAEGVADGLGPTMNLDSCGGCHSHPAMGGSSPPVNPQMALAKTLGQQAKVSSFLSETGPVREVRFVRNADGSPDGGVHGIFTITGMPGAETCKLTQPDFATQLQNRNLVFRIPTPLFGAGLIEYIPDREIIENQARSAQAKLALGIRGRPNMLLTSGSISGQPNKNGNDGTIGRFGHKAQNKSLLIFSGEAYNVEMGITNGAFPTERDETDGCMFGAAPNDDVTLEGEPGKPAPTPLEAISSIDRFTLFMRFLAPPKPSNNVKDATSESIALGRTAFDNVGCALCHTPSLNTYKNVAVAAMRNQPVNLYSDLLLHDMGIGLADGVQQGQAGGRDWRSSPLWGLGQRLFFLHDGRTSDLRQAIAEHASPGSEANGVTRRFFALPVADQQNLLNFLRSL
jgi:CxxC motif-containing protein (DUF1111 family)